MAEPVHDQSGEQIVKKKRDTKSNVKHDAKLDKLTITRID